MDFPMVAEGHRIADQGGASTPKPIPRNAS